MKAIFVLTFVFYSASIRAQDAPKLDTQTVDAAFSQAVKRPGAIPGTKGLRTRDAARSSVAPEQERIYGKSVRIIKRTDGSASEAPYVKIPILFVKDGSDLLGDTSRDNVALLAQKVKEYGAKGARFSIEGHASAEGQDARNQLLSEQRASALRELLIRQYGLDPVLIESVQGFGARFARAPATANEDELQQDRRVLVVRER